jgi:hypothetical protein
VKHEVRNDFDNLKVLLKDMDVPPRRLEDPAWLSRNLSVRNKNHPNFEAALNVVMKLLKAGFRHPPK